MFREVSCIEGKIAIHIEGVVASKKFPERKRTLSRELSSRTKRTSVATEGSLLTNKTRERVALTSVLRQSAARKKGTIPQ